MYARRWDVGKGGGDVWVGNLKTRSALPLYEAGEQFVMEKGFENKTLLPELHVCPCECF
jgi:hypothetical protein